MNQPISLKTYGYFWAGVIIVTVGMLWILGEVLAPFITGMAIAYLLNPTVTYLSRHLPRSVATVIILLSFALIVIGLVVGLSPMIGRQLTEFSTNMPQYFNKWYQLSTEFINNILGRMKPEDVARVREAAGAQIGAVLKGGQDLLVRVWSGGMAVIDIVTFLIITPVVAFYCLRDWLIITKRVDSLLPRQSADKIRRILAEFNTRLAGFVRGQLLVCICLGTFYAIGLTMVGLNFGLAIGLMAGLLSFIPYIGSIFGFVASVGVAFVQFGGFQMPLGVAGIFFLGQFIEGNFLTPKLVGERIGLHAVWVIFALLAGGKLFGFTGMLIAVPLAAMLGVVIRHALIWYQHSPAYLGHQRTEE